MCDFFWLSPADQGDLSDVVRASLQHPRPHHRLPSTVVTPTATTVCTHGSHDLPAHEEELLLLQGLNCACGGDDHAEVVHLQQQQLVHGDGMGFMVSSSSGSYDHPVLLQSSPSYPQPLQPEGLIRHIMSEPANVVEREGDAAAPEMDEHGLHTAMAPPHPHAPPIKRRKSQTKKVVCIPAPTAAPPGVGGRPSASGEVVPSDLWAWRKYGQKPIKGSPYPRGYYRCSSSKGCSARKQVERSRTDPSMLVITYTSDHNHPWPTQRNALAGSTRPASSSSAKSHHHQHHSVPAVPPPLPSSPHHYANNIIVNNITLRSIGNTHQQQLPKQEVLDMDHPKPEQEVAAAADHDLDMFADMDGALNILFAPNFNSEKQQQHATAADDDNLEKLPEEDDKQQQQLLDPFSFSFFGSFGVGEAANKDG
ncbi:probable WRKY transcription factor 14 [Phragmites australis]|uniref:probable WRKY transcription factor 14 n=1 Tax=Phragmites australis TaxID=29695 RepID=UPI002D79A511|nr:probable WRKY transcription factor 14 [Phragmites australis]